MGNQQYFLRRDDLSQIITDFDKTKSLTHDKNFYQTWQTWHDKNQEYLDNKPSWINVCDKNDIGCEVNFDK